jgi:hypothetical protein
MPQIFKVYQIKLDTALIDLINTEGWACHVRALAYSRASFGDVAIALAHFEDVYTHVANVIADDLEHLFDVGNIGPEDRIERLDRMSSISVGNVVEDAQGRRFVCANIGWKEIVNGAVLEAV